MATIKMNRKVWMARQSARLGAALAGMLLLNSCVDLNLLDTNAPTAEQLTDAPTRTVMALAATGIFSSMFTNIGTEIEFYALYGREGYNLLGNDPRETGEQIRGPQDPTARNSGIWNGPYSSIRTINTYLAALPTATGLTDQERKASSGFAKTMKAWMIHRLAIRTGDPGVPIDVDRPISDDPAPFVSFAAAMSAASSLMDEGLADLQAGGSSFPFAVAPGFSGFETPSAFAKFNRALAAKILVHRATFVGCNECWQQAKTAMDASFVTDVGLPESLKTGVYYGYSSAANEPSNPVTEPVSSNHYWVHPSIIADAQLRGDGSPDLRLTEKVLDSGRERALNDLVGEYKPSLYNSATDPTVPDLNSPIPWIANEELLLLRAEIRWNTADRAGAIDDLNLIREQSGGLEPTTLNGGSSDDAFVTELLYNRLYSLLWSQGTRWIDARRYGRLGQLPLDRAGDNVYDGMLIPANECAARNLEVPCDNQVQVTG